MVLIMRGIGGDATEEFLTSLSGAARQPRQGRGNGTEMNRGRGCRVDRGELGVGVGAGYSLAAVW
jgi:hypothetical protein